MATYAELMAQAKEMFNQAEEARRSEQAAVITEIRAKMKEFGITTADLGATTKTKAGKSIHPARFKGPSGQLWSGLGRYPDWLRAEIVQGRTKDGFKI